MTARPAAVLVLVAAIALTASACSSTGPSPAASASAASARASQSSVAAAQSAIASEVASQAAASAEASAASAPCITKTCIVDDAKQLVGNTAQDESVVTAMSCRKSTVRRAAPGVWTVHCTATYSDGQQVSGIASVLLSKDQVAWEPTG